MANNIKDWSTTAGDNEQTVPIGAPTTWFPSEVSKTVRQHMADHRDQWQNAEWFNWGHTATQTSATTFTIPTDVTSIYIPARRLRITDSTILHAKITASSYSAPNTTITVLVDGGTPLTTAMNGQKVEVGIISPINSSIPVTIAVPTGSVIQMAATSLPSGYLECNGQAVSRTTYNALFAVISTTWGVGDGSTTFNVPDFRGLFLRGLDSGRGLDPGRAFATYQGDTFGSHTHSWDYKPMFGTSDGPGSYAVGTGATQVTTAAGGSETRGKNQTVYFCIKT